MVRMDSREFAHWIAYTRVEPIGDDREDLRAAMIANTVARSMGGKTDLKDFIIDFWTDPTRDKEAKEKALVEKIKLFGRELNAAKGNRKPRKKQRQRS